MKAAFAAGWATFARSSSAAIAVLALMPVTARDDANFERIFRMLEPLTTDTRLARGAGLAAFDRRNLAAAGDRPTTAQRERLAARAFDLLDRAIMSRPDDAEAVWAYALLSAAQKREAGTQ